MARQTRIKRGSIDLNSVFSPGYMLDTDGKLITGYIWKKFTPQLNPNSQSITEYQLPEIAHVVDSTILLYMFVNGVKVEPEYLSLNEQENTILEYNDVDYQIVPSDAVDIWYVPTASVGGQAEELDQELPQAAGAGGHLQINDGQDQITFAPVKWINNALVPDQDIVYDLGTPTKRWNDLYLNSNSIVLGAATISFNTTQNKLAINGEFLATSNEVDPQTLIQDQTFVNALQGPTGPQGPVGPQGPQGLQGIQGLQGPAGNDGLQGTQGPQGAQGLQGLTGPQGNQGPQGPAGVSITFKGAVNQDPSGSGLVTLITASTFTPSSGDAVLSQTDDSLFVFDGSNWVDGGSIQGPQGIQGIQGIQGPQGPAGADGSDGAQGAQGPQGPQGIQGQAGLSVSTLSINGTTVAATLSDNSTTISGTVDMSLTNLSDVDIYHTSSTITDGYVLTYDSTHGHWHPEPITQSTNNNVALNDLSDVNSSLNPTENQFLFYNGTDWTSQVVHNVYREAHIQTNLLNANSNYQLVKGTPVSIPLTGSQYNQTYEVAEVVPTFDYIYSVYHDKAIGIVAETHTGSGVFQVITKGYMHLPWYGSAIKGDVVYLDASEMYNTSLDSTQKFTTDITKAITVRNEIHIVGKVIQTNVGTFGHVVEIDFQTIPYVASSKVNIARAATTSFLYVGGLVGTNLYILNSQLTVDGIALSVGDKILIKDNLQYTNGFQLNGYNGVWEYIASGSTQGIFAPFRETPHLGQIITISEGTTNENKIFICTDDANKIYEELNLSTPASIENNDTSISIQDTGSNGNINFTTDGTSRWDINSSGHIIPNTNATYDIGSAEKKVRHFYLSNNSLKFGPTTDDSVTGTLSVDANGLSYNNELLATQAYVAANAGGGSTNEPISILKMENNTLQSLGSSEYSVGIRDWGFSDNGDGSTIDLKNAKEGLFDADLSKMQAVDTYPIISYPATTGPYVLLPGDYKVKYYISYLMRNGNVVPNYYATNPQLANLYWYNNEVQVLDYEFQNATSSSQSNLDFYIIANIRVGSANVQGLNLALNWSSYYTYFQGVNSWKAEIQKFTDGSL